MNNRQIKFKFWDKDNKEWISGSEIEFQENGEPFDLYEKNIIYLQFTGLLDKNGKEIYEGDILLLPDEYTESILDYGQGPIEPCNHISEIVFNIKEGAFGVKITDKANFIKNGFNSFSKLLYDMGNEYLNKECLIIGNIFENFELLNKKDD